MGSGRDWAFSVGAGMWSVCGASHLSAWEGPLKKSELLNFPGAVFVFYSSCWQSIFLSEAVCLWVPFSGTFLSFQVIHPEVILQPQPFPDTAPPAQKWAFPQRTLDPINSCQMPSFRLCELSSWVSGFLASRAGKVSWSRMVGGCEGHMQVPDLLNEKMPFFTRWAPCLFFISLFLISFILHFSPFSSLTTWEVTVPLTAVARVEAGGTLREEFDFWGRMLPVESQDYALAPKFSLKLGGECCPGDLLSSSAPRHRSHPVCFCAAILSNGEFAFYGDSNKLALADKPDGSYFGVI